MKSLIKVMKALSDPNRVKIIKMLQKKKMCVCELRAVLNLAQPTVSKHLKILEEAGLVDSEKDKIWVNYVLVHNPESPYARAMLGHLEKWLNEDKCIEEINKILPSIDRKDICKT